MEKDNKKAREDARREYNDTVRVSEWAYQHRGFSYIIQSLAKFLRKRDPRYKTHLAQAQSQASGSATPIGTVTPKPAPRPEYVEQEWQKVDALRQHDDLEWAAAEGEDPEEWECVVCGKSFWSEAAWDSHERSKKHLREVERLKKEMLEDDEEFGLAVEQEEEVEDAVPEVPQTPTLPVEDLATSIAAVQESSSPLGKDPETSLTASAPVRESSSPPLQQDEQSTRPNGKKKKPKKATNMQSEPLTKTEKMARDLGEVELAQADGPGGEVDEPSISAPTKRDLRKARQAKKADEAAGKEVGRLSVFTGCAPS
jgi:DnaJ family protein A protein 5